MPKNNNKNMYRYKKIATGAVVGVGIFAGGICSLPVECDPDIQGGFLYDYYAQGSQDSIISTTSSDSSEINYN